MIDVVFALLAVALQEPADQAADAAAPAAETAALVAEPQVPTGQFTTALEIKPILAATRGSWISVREFDGQDLLYVTHLWAWRCGLVQLKVGVNGAAPEVWPLPECHLDQASPNAITDQDGLPYRSYALQSISQIEVEITYDDLTRDSARFNRLGQVQN